MSSSIKSLSIDELVDIVESYGQPKFRAKQIHEWIHKHNVTSYEEMTNVPKALREKLAEQFPMSVEKILEKAESSDGSRKYLIELFDGLVVEAVGITDGNDDDARLTVCISSQVGCSMDCSFCATGKQGLSRNLSADEIVSQVSLVGKDFGSRVDNVVLMGQGEPFQNYEAVIEAVKRINSDEGLNIGARHITISTSGIEDGIYRLSEEPEQFRLAVSLHSADQSTRNRLMPRLSGQPLRKLKQALTYYCEEKGRRITIEYMLLRDINDSDEQLTKLIDFCEGLNVHINLLTYNSVPGTGYKPSDTQTLLKWEKEISSSGIPVSVRQSKGTDIAGACGQLKGKRMTDTIQEQ